MTKMPDMIWVGEIGVAPAWANHPFRTWSDSPYMATNEPPVAYIRADLAEVMIEDEQK